MPSSIPAEADTSDQGRLIAGKYRLLSVLGYGGMGAVWLARNEALAIDVALKLIHRTAASPAASARLEQEAQAAARLAHPSIVRVFDFGTDQGDPFIVMELLRGESLGRLLQERTRLSAVEAVRIVIPVLRALEHAHTAGIVHRDLKPDNILLVGEPDGTVTPKVVDFGIAKLRRDDVDRGLTIDGALLGTPDYMSPAQARGEAHVDDGADIWAMSVVLYEMLVGRVPFDGPNYNALLNAILCAEPEPTTNFAAGDAELWSIVATGLAKRREARWANIGAMAAALSAWCVARDVVTDVTGAILVGRGRESLTSMPSIPPSLRSGRPSLATGPVTLHATPNPGGDLAGFSRSSAPPAFSPSSRPPYGPSSVPPSSSPYSVPPDASRYSVPPGVSPYSVPPRLGPLSTSPHVTPRPPAPTDAPPGRRRPIALAGAALALVAAVGFFALRPRSSPSTDVRAPAAESAAAPVPVLAPMPTATETAVAPASADAPAASASSSSGAARKPGRKVAAPAASSPRASAPPAAAEPPRVIPSEPNF